MNSELVTSIVLVFVVIIFGFLWGHYHGSKEVYSMEWDTKNRLARYEAALKDIADWDNYNLGGDVAFGGKHPALIAEGALKGEVEVDDENDESDVPAMRASG